MRRRESEEEQSEKEVYKPRKEDLLEAMATY